MKISRRKRQIFLVCRRRSKASCSDPLYGRDGGPLTDEQLEQIGRIAAATLPKGSVFRSRSLFDDVAEPAVRPLEEKLDNFDRKKHGGEVMNFPPVGKELDVLIRDSTDHAQVSTSKPKK